MHVLKHCNHGHGNAHVAVDLACMQSREGDSVAYVSGGGDYEELLSRNGVELVHIDQSGRSIIGSIRAVLSLLKFSVRFKPDLIHAHMMSGAVFGYLVSRILRVPLITTVHNSFDKHSTLMRLGDIVVAVSRAELNFLEKRGFRKDRLVYILNGPNNSPRDEGWSSDSANLDLHKPCFTTVCGLHARKGVRDLILGFRDAIVDYPRWHLNIVGDGPDRSDLERLVSNLKLTDSIHFLGSVAYPRQVLTMSEAFVLASYADPCSLAIGEALFSGCATIGTAVGGTPELLGHGAYGILIDPGKPDQISAAMKMLMDDPAGLLSWKAKAKQQSHVLTVERLSRDYRQVYEKAIISRALTK